MATMGELWANIGSIAASLMFVWAIFRQCFPHHLWSYVKKYSKKQVRFVYPHIQIKFPEFTGEGMNRSDVLSAIQSYLSTTDSTRATRFRADMVKDSQSLVLSMDDKEEVTNEFKGVKVWWALLSKSVTKTQSFSLYPAAEEKRYYKLTFHKRDRELIMDSYVNHVLKEGKANTVRNRQRKLYTNNPKKWSHVYFEHPATFDTLRMEVEKKQAIMKDLTKFTKGKEYYKKIGRAWKQGYLLYGPPGTGNSTMIAAMANFLNYDVYDLELTTVKENMELRNLLIETSNKSIIVIEDIDCSLDHTGQLHKKKKKDEDVEEETNQIVKKAKEEQSEGKSSNVTLSGLLNFIDGLWSACGEERIIVFTESQNIPMIC